MSNNAANQRFLFKANIYLMTDIYVLHWSENFRNYSNCMATFQFWLVRCLKRADCHFHAIWLRFLNFGFLTVQSVAGFYYLWYAVFCSLEFFLCPQKQKQHINQFNFLLFALYYRRSTCNAKTFAPKAYILGLGLLAQVALCTVVGKIKVIMVKPLNNGQSRAI